MKNAAKQIRQAYNMKLENITWGGEKVPNYQSQPSVTLPKRYIELSSVDTTNVLNDNKFITEATVTVEVVTSQYKYQDRSVADEIAQSIMDVILPNIGGFLDDEYFWIGHIQLESSRYLEEIDEKGMFITRKILIFTQTLIEK